MDIATIKQGMGLDSLIGSNAPASAFQSLTSPVTSKTIDVLHPNAPNGVIAKLNELAANTDRPQQLVDALDAFLNNIAKSINDQIASDLASQSTVAQSQSVQDLATQIIPASPTGSSDLFGLVTTPAFKKIYGTA